MNKNFLALLTAAAVSTAALVSACGAADEPAANAGGEAAKTEAAAPAADAAPVQVADAGDKADAAPKADAGEKKADDAAPAAEAAAPAELTDDNFMSAIDRVNASPKGTLKNPYTGNPEMIAQGEKVWFGLSCNGCHGGGGGGGMCPPVTNEVWVYGGDDDTLFRLITLGSQDLQKEGYARKGTEGVVGPMMAYRDLIDDERKLWKLIAWVRTKWNGREERKEW
ncbi:c-type cytochrome [Hyphomicrobium sp.]|uniref:c-type cytochrome n=1 Tax=Hyphomicrobium sp. TaxID=82 RepID=UPI002CEAF61C|nr:c-type cytochrome [Hyphomicrobium sp.]HRN89126.1 c-type cytochrome [Hyphomicrobium sp.]HRQ27952.1 c-type cytochrome [Hyphomicrobium sp.]